MFQFCKVVWIRRLLMVVLLLGLAFGAQVGAESRTVLYVAAHGDDIIITAGQLHRELGAGSEVYILFTGSAGLEPESCPLATVLEHPGHPLRRPHHPSQR